MVCPYCRETIQDGAIKCRYCGSMLATAPFGVSSPVSDEEVKAFVGNNSEYYLRSFSKFTAGGAENFTLTWNWSAFGFTFIWMLYRKMYVQAVVTFFIFCIPGINLLMHIVVGCCSNYLYYLHARNKISEVRQRVAPERLYPALHETGGVHGWAITVGIVALILIAMMFWSFFAALVHLWGATVTCHTSPFSI